MSTIGAPLTRVDGRLKVTGAAKYSAEFEIPNFAYAVMVQSTIPCGRIAQHGYHDGREKRWRDCRIDARQCA